MKKEASCSAAMKAKGEKEHKDGKKKEGHSEKRKEAEKKKK